MVTWLDGLRGCDIPLILFAKNVKILTIFINTGTSVYGCIQVQVQVQVQVYVCMRTHP